MTRRPYACSAAASRNGRSASHHARHARLAAATSEAHAAARARWTRSGGRAEKSAPCGVGAGAGRGLCFLECRRRRRCVAGDGDARGREEKGGGEGVGGGQVWFPSIRGDGRARVGPGEEAGSLFVVWLEAAARRTGACHVIVFPLIRMSVTDSD